METLKKQFQKNGWFILDLPDPTPIFKTRSYLQNELTNLLGKPVSLEDYHHSIDNDTVHTEVQTKLTALFRECKKGPSILTAQTDFFTQFLGPDLFVQTKPYLRITRPHQAQDNVGFHRDTFYGGSPYELSVWIPFVDLPPESSLSVLSGSHIHPEDYYPTTHIKNPDTTVTKGSAKHQSGFLYAPKVMHPSIEKKMEPIPLKLGQALVFSLAIVHGSCMNKGSVSRWSTDVRIMNALAPVDLSTRCDYYTPWSCSVVTESAQKYNFANK